MMSDQDRSKCWVLLVLLVVSCFFKADAQRNSSSGGLSDYLFLPDVYGEESGLVKSSGCPASAFGSSSAPHFFLSGNRPYSISGWQQLQGTASLPLQQNTLGVNLYYDGLEQYTNLGVGLIMARPLSKQWTIAAGVLQQSQKFPGARPRMAWGYRIGAHALLSPAWILFVELGKSATLSPVFQSSQFWPHNFRTDLFYKISNSVQFVSSLIKQHYQPAFAVLTFRYRVLPNLSLRAGLTTQSQSFGFGAGYQHTRWNWEIFISSHPYLGQSMGIGVGWSPLVKMAKES